MGKIITLYNNKGGVGKTTSAINIAYVLAAIRKKKVLVIDCDGQGNASSFFSKNEPVIGLEEALTVKASAIEPMNTRYEKIDIVATTSKMNNAAFLFSSLSSEDKRFNVSKILEIAESKYDFIIIDLPPTLNELVSSILTICDNVFVPLELGSFSVQGIAAVTEVIASAGVVFGGCFVTRFDRKNKADLQLYDMMRKALGNKLMYQTVPQSNVVKNSVSCSMTALEYMGWTEAAASYVVLTNDIIERCGGE